MLHYLNLLLLSYRNIVLGEQLVYGSLASFPSVYYEQMLQVFLAFIIGWHMLFVIKKHQVMAFEGLVLIHGSGSSI